MVGETADPVLLSSRAGGRWLTAGAFVLAAALLATQSFDLKRSAAPKPDFAMEFRIAETVKPAPAPTPEVKKVPEVKQVPKAAPVTAVPPVKREAQKPRVIASRTAVSPVTVEEPKPTVALRFLRFTVRNTASCGFLAGRGSAESRDPRRKKVAGRSSRGTAARGQDFRRGVETDRPRGAKEALPKERPPFRHRRRS